MTFSGENRREERACAVCASPCNSQHSQAESDTREVCTEPIGTGGNDDTYSACEVAASQMCTRMILVLVSFTSSLPLGHTVQVALPAMV